MDELKKWLIYQINQPSEMHNIDTYLWSRGFRKACMIVLEFIERIEKEGK